MAQRKKPLVGLDIDPSGLAAAAVSVNGRIRIEQAAVAPLEPGIIRDGEVVDADALAEALRAFFRVNKGLDKRVRIGLANQKIVVRVLEVPPVTDPKELEAVVRFHAEDELPMAVDQAVLDYRSLDDVETPGGPRLRVLLVAARRDMVERMLGAVRSAGLRAEGIDLAAFAMVRALHRAGSEDEPVLYLAIGGLTNLAVAQGSTCLFTRASGGGLEGLAVELAERCQLTLEHARGWLTHVGLETPLEDIDGDERIVPEVRRVLLEGVRRIAAEVRNSLDFHAAQGHDAAVSRAVMTGPAAAVPGFVAALASELALPVEAGTVDGIPEGIDAGSLTVAAGLAVEEAPA
jgi:type IV pilus assembly protein PilM